MSRLPGLSLLMLTALLVGAAPVMSDTLSPAQPVILEAGFFGIHFHRLQLSPGDKALQTVWPPLNFGMVRLWDSRTRWADLEPARGEWNFGRLDHYVNEAQANGAQVLYTLGSTPRWASTRPDEPCSYGKGCAAEPRSMEDWREYVRVVARRYRGRICCYELWNEPKFSDIARDRKFQQFFTGSISSMVEMARIARQVLKEEDASAMLLTPGFVNGPDRLDLFLSAGGGEYVQGIAYHFYAWNDENRMLREIETVRALLHKHGLQNLPLWSTEAGVEVREPGSLLKRAFKSRITREEAAAMMVRQIVLNAFAGIDKYFYYAWDNEHSGMVDHTGHFHPSRDAMILVQRWLIGAKPERCDIEKNRPTVCWGEKDGKPFAIVWNPANSNFVDVPLPKGLRITTRQVAVPRWGGPMQTVTGADSMLATPNPAFYTFEQMAQQ